MEDLSEADWARRFETRATRIRRILADPKAVVASRNPRFVLPDPPRPDVRIATWPWDMQYRVWRDTTFFIFYDYI